MSDEEERDPTTASWRNGGSMDREAYRYPFPNNQLLIIPHTQYRWPVRIPESAYNHDLLERATPAIIAEYGLRDVHPGRIPPTFRLRLLILVLFVRRLLAHAPHLAPIILDCLTPYIDETPIIRPIRFLFFPEYRAICRFVADLPMSWGELDARSKVNALYDRMTQNQAMEIRHAIVMPDPNVWHIVIAGAYNEVPVLREVPAGVYPLRMMVGFWKFQEKSLTMEERLRYYTTQGSLLRGSVVPYFTDDMSRVAQEAGFKRKVANDVGRLLFGATRMFREKYPKGDDAWREVKKEMGIYTHILHMHRRPRWVN